MKEGIKFPNGYDLESSGHGNDSESIKRLNDDRSAGPDLKDWRLGEFIGQGTPPEWYIKKVAKLAIQPSETDS